MSAPFENNLLRIWCQLFTIPSSRGMKTTETHFKIILRIAVNWTKNVGVNDILS